MSSKELVECIRAGRLAGISGETPWKTINARISQDIRQFGDRSKFKRTFHGRFALRHWTFEPEFEPRRRVVNPLDEVIKAVPRQTFRRIAAAMAAGSIDPTDFRVLVGNAIDLDRRTAEETEDYVQIIPSFVIADGDRILTYRRTKRLPEARLHHATCVNFGGHMQADDMPSLFWNDDDVFNQFLFRELFEELEFSPAPSSIEAIGLIYLQGSAFERQHVGLSYLVRLMPGTEVESLEPGMHAEPSFVKLSTLDTRIDEFDSWSRVLIGALHGHI